MRRSLSTKRSSSGPSATISAKPFLSPRKPSMQMRACHRPRAGSSFSTGRQPCPFSVISQSGPRMVPGTTRPWAIMQPSTPVPGAGESIVPTGVGQSHRATGQASAA
jgi:hypothetical protein